jgi:hypothetical protein
VRLLRGWMQYSGLGRHRRGPTEVSVIRTRRSPSTVNRHTYFGRKCPKKLTRDSAPLLVAANTHGKRGRFDSFQGHLLLEPVALRLISGARAG